jgi:hypothetical protein
MLTDQRETFARSIAAGADKTAAAALAYPAASRESQARQARRLLKAPRVQERIAELSCQPIEAVRSSSPASLSRHAAGNVPAPALADLVAVAFDGSQPDLVRLAALRRRSVCRSRFLSACRRSRDGGSPACAAA